MWVFAEVIVRHMKVTVGVRTLLAGVNVPSTSNNKIVFFTGRSWSGGTTAPAAAISYWKVANIQDIPQLNEAIE